MIDVKINNEEEVIQYPCLMQLASIDHTITNNLVVLFHESKKGLVMIPGYNASRGKGEYREDWIMDNFRPYNRSITIKNI